MTFFLSAGAAFWWAVFTVLWRRQEETRNATAVDVAWAFGIGLQTAALGWEASGDVVRRSLVTVLVGAWSLRLGGHLLLDRVMKGVEDARYARFRREWGRGEWYGFYMMQAVLVVLLPLTFWAAFQSRRPFPALADGIGLALWSFSIAGEALADRQLARFRGEPANKGKTCRDGLWRFSRHPNYFFEWLIWLSFVPLAWGSPLFPYSLLGPGLLFLFLTRVSGIPPTEAQALSSRGEDYRAYQRTTSAFFPWFPKRTDSAR